jgi:hypothetical protein
MCVPILTQAKFLYMHLTVVWPKHMESDHVKEIDTEEGGCARTNKQTQMASASRLK